MVDAMKLKLDENNQVVVQDGKPVYVHDDGKEVAFDAPGTVATISRLNGEAKRNRERYETAEANLVKFEGIEDPEAAKTALSTVKNLNDKKLIDAGEVEKVKAEAIKALEEKYKPVTEKAERLERELYAEKIGGAFARSKYISDKVAVPSDIVQSRFGSAFKIENGRVVAYDQSNNQIFSRAKPGELADFEEALELLIDTYPHKDQILKGIGSSGTGAPANGSGQSRQQQQKPGALAGDRSARLGAIGAMFPDLPEK